MSEIYKKKKKTEKKEGDKSYSERVRAKLFCYAFKLGFLRLIWKASLKLFEFTVSFINYYKRKRIIQVKAFCVGV